MAIPVYLQQFKAAGIYRVVFDKSTVLNQDTQMLRLVVGYSEKGPFNVPVYIKDSGEFRQMFGEPSRKLEKRGIFFHRLALQMLQVSPILCLNLKKFDGETVSGATISTDFNPKFNPIDTVKLKVEDIYDTTRFWDLDENQLNGARSVDGTVLDQYINICVKDTKANSGTYFIRKASGQKVAGYNLTVHDWYSDRAEEIPEYLEGKENNLMSDYFAEIYVFKGKFTAKQVLASETLKNYFMITDELDENDEPVLVLRNQVFDGFGDPVDPLDALYQDETSGAIGHWVGSLIPDFKNKQGAYAALNVLFNSDADVHNMMMSFNTDLLEEGNGANIDLSGRLFIPTNKAVADRKVFNTSLSLEKIYDGSATTSVLGNLNAPVIADEIKFGVNVYDLNASEGEKALIPLETNGKTKIYGTLYVSSIDNDIDKTYEELVENGEGGEYPSETTSVNTKISTITLNQVGNTDEDKKITITVDDQYQAMKIAAKLGVVVKSYYTEEDVAAAEAELEDGATLKFKAGDPKELKLEDGYGTYYNGDAFIDEESPLDGPEKVITSISRLEGGYSEDYDIFTDVDENLKVNFMDVEIITNTKFVNGGNIGENSVYGTSVSFIDYNENNWEFVDDQVINGVYGTPALISKNYSDKSLLAVLQNGDTILADDGTNDLNLDDEIDSKDKDYYYDNVYVTGFGTEYYTEEDAEVKAKTKAVGEFKFYYVTFSAEPLLLIAQPTENAELSQNNYIIRVDGALNREVGTMVPQYLEGYTYKNDKPEGTGMWAKVQWQKFILSALTDYKGLRTGLLNKSEIDYRYVIDTFESFPDTNIKNVLSFLCKEKQSAFCIANFPSVRSFVKCPYASFTDRRGLFDVQYVVDGFNKKKAASIKFSLPSDADGASFIAFYTPLKFSDGYIDSIIPSAGLVSNLFVDKYISRQPYYIVAGPNYGNINASGLVGPDHKYSQDELQIIEPFGVNCMVYRPNFGTFINANQTAKQTPVSALSKVHVRELVIYLQDEIEKVLQRYQWEFNNQRTRNAILDKANNICELVKANGGLQDYKNIMDESNNTPEIIDNEMAVLSTHIEPGRGMGKMVHELHIYRTGEMQASISAQ